MANVLTKQVSHVDAHRHCEPKVLDIAHCLHTSNAVRLKYRPDGWVELQTTGRFCFTC
eukprot:NODE_6099_length_372_cov_61.399381_g5380_i0.p2 GENE.NODE_6099_length_372_cov_61.399381_g5380_i0~~NODE_6099_length_372_cov_61.399381_g5380_i0.p2  ORF type:complete len:58 (-),score=1.86 NODE_6099_length_372_cov_61.399381_g5380_i0:4-177(-)